MIATLVVEYADGSWASFREQHGLEDRDPRGRRLAAERVSTIRHGRRPWSGSRCSGKRSESLGNPWIPDSVKALRHDFTISAPIKSARLYATALGAYEMFLNGKRVGDQVLAPGWTDYRERVIYQTYDVTEQCARATTPSARCLRRAGTRRRSSGSSSRTTTASRRQRCARSCASSTPTAAWSG